MKRQPGALQRRISPSLSSSLRAGIAATCLIALAGCSSDSDDPAAPAAPTPPIATASRINVDVARTTYGVPHVRANDFRSLGYGLA